MLAVAGAFLIALALIRLSSALVGLLSHAHVFAGSFAVLAAVALFIRWRLDGRAQSWWLATAFCVVGISAVATNTSEGYGLVGLSSVAVALVLFFAASHAPQVDSILTVRLAGATCAVSLLVAAFAYKALSGWPHSTRAVALVLGGAYFALAFSWAKSQQDKPWFVVVLAGFALSCVAFALGPGRSGAAVSLATMQVVVNGVAAVIVMRGLQAVAVGHRSLALDAERERDLVSSMREDLEARYADTLHEVRSIVLALEGGILLRPTLTGGAADDSLTQSLVAELERLRSLADPDHAAVPGDFPLEEALRHLIALSRANEWPVAWEMDERVMVRGRPADVAQVMHSLLTNARKYAPGPVEVRSMEAGRFVLVLVDDHGPGVKPANRERIFERGERPEHDQGAEGHGLGLHIARRLARELGGELWVEQNPGGGARFVFAMRAVPVASDSAGHHQRNAS
jgi:signal transduction histidine kinase